MAVRSPYDFLWSPYDSRTMLGVRTILKNCDITVRMPHDHPKGLRSSYYFSPQIIIKPCGDRTINRTVSVRRPYDDATYDVSTGYGLTIFKICKSADYYKIVEATEIAGSRRKS